jgi:hypothetical protein
MDNETLAQSDFLRALASAMSSSTCQQPTKPQPTSSTAPSSRIPSTGLFRRRLQQRHLRQVRALQLGIANLRHPKPRSMMLPLVADPNLFSR